MVGLLIGGTWENESKEKTRIYLKGKDHVKRYGVIGTRRCTYEK